MGTGSRVLRWSVLTLGALLAGGTLSGCGGDPTESGAKEATTSSSTSTIPPNAPVDLQLRGVLADEGYTSDLPPAQGEELVLVGPDGNRVLLGPTLAEGALFESAEVVQSADGSWEIRPVLRPGPDGIDAFNQATALCFEAAPDCPSTTGGRGRLALVIGGELVTAPEINEPSFGRDQILITGGFTEEQANTIADQLAR